MQSSERKPLDAARMFTSLTLLILLNSPLSQLFQSIPDLFAAVNCIRRIQDYLNADSRNDYRSAKLSSPSSATPHDSSDESHILAHSVTDDIELRHMTIAAGKRTTSNTEGAEAISVRQGAFGWGRDAEPIVRDIDLSLKQSTLTMVIGPIASGKSTLVKALLGEVSILRGSVQLATLDIAYCDQHAWLINASLQRNILGFANFDGPWYRSVTRACALDKDIATLPNGDRTLIGSGGITLSGGQKQRVVRVIVSDEHGSAELIVPLTGSGTSRIRQEKHYDLR
jgi:ATP-binding cassette subfamily C (CFTR/MRP) protein 1